MRSANPGRAAVRPARQEVRVAREQRLAAWHDALHAVGTGARRRAAPEPSARGGRRHHGQERGGQLLEQLGVGPAQVDGDGARPFVGDDAAREVAASGRLPATGRPGDGVRKRHTGIPSDSPRALHRGPEVAGPDRRAIGVSKAAAEPEHVAPAAVGGLRHVGGQTSHQPCSGRAAGPAVLDQAVVGELQHGIAAASWPPLAGSRSNALPTRSVPPRCAAGGATAVTQMEPPTAARPAGVLPVRTVSTIARVLGSRRSTAPLASATHRAWSAIVSATGEPPAGTVSVTRSVAGSIRDTVPSWRLAIHTAPSPTATAAGPLPTGIAARTSPERGSMRATVPDSSAAAHTDPAPVASAAGWPPTAMRLVIRPDRRSIRTTSPSSAVAAHRAP